MERERDRDTETQRHRDTERERERASESEREGEREESELNHQDRKAKGERSVSYLSNLIGRQHDDISALMKALRGSEVANPLQGRRTSLKTF